jgi:hypothetical protein
MRWIIPYMEFPMRNSESRVKFRMRKFRVSFISMGESMKTIQEPMLDTVLRRLEESKGDWPKVAEESGVPYQTITKIGGRFVADPRHSTVQALFDYFTALPEQPKGQPTH